MSTLTLEQAAKIVDATLAKARELGLKPLIALRQITVIKGTPSVFGDLPLAMVRASGKLEMIDEFRFDKDSKKINLKNKQTTTKV